MDKRLSKIVCGSLFPEYINKNKVFLVDTYNQLFYTDIAPTIKSRIDSNNNIRIVERISSDYISEDDGNHVGQISVTNEYKHETSRLAMLELKSTRDGDNNGHELSYSADPLNDVCREVACLGYSRDRVGHVKSYHMQSLSNTIHGSSGGGGNTDCFVVEPIVKQVGNVVDVEKNCIKMSRHQMTDLKPSPDGITNTLPGVQKDNLLAESCFRIRKLTPRECFRLMGVPDVNVDLIEQAGISNCQQYKMAGNSIVVDCLEHIFDKLLVHKMNDDAQMSLF